MTMLLSPQILAVGNGILTPIETALANPSPGITMEVDEISQKKPTPNTKTLSIVSSNFSTFNNEASRLLLKKQNKLSLLYVFSSYLFGILLFLLGYLFTKTVVFN